MFFYAYFSDISIKEQDKRKGTSNISVKEHVLLCLSKVSVKEQNLKIVPLCLFQVSVKEQGKRKGTYFSRKNYNNSNNNSSKNNNKDNTKIIQR